ncbi:MAG: TonB-dependent receptor [Steroidobacteraceae bacterium]|jgi:iron complex outermembrane receptor protein
MVTSKKHFRSVVTLVSTLATAASMSAALAQTKSQGDGLVLEEIVVTARKAEERLLDVPLAIKAFSAEQIEEKGIRNLDDVAAATPGLTFSDVQAGFLPVPVIRGFAPIDVRGENNAAVFIDGVFVSGKEGLNFNQTDLERIEVIKGPQAALYGRNSFSGAINYVTAKPGDVVKGKAEVQFGSNGKRALAGSVSGPVVEGVLKGRIAVSYDNFDGSYNNQYSGAGGKSDIGGYEYQSAQGTLLWTPSDAFEAQLQAYISNDVVGNSAISPVVANCENLNSLLTVQSPVPAAGYMNYCGTFPAVGRNGLSAVPQATGNKRDIERASLSITWNTGIGTISSLTGYSKVGQGFLVDGSRNTGETVPFVYIARPATGLATLVPGTFFGGEQKVLRTGLYQIGGGGVTEEVSTELRLTSKTEQKLRWAVGGYFYDTKSHGGNDGVKATQPLPSDFYAFCLSCRTAAPFGRPTLIYDPANDPAATGGVDTTGFKNWFVNPTGDAIFSDTYRNKVTATSAFASLEYDFTDTVKGRLEGRYTDEKKSFNNILTARTGSKSWGLNNWRTTLDWKPQPNVTIYGSYAHAEKSGNIGAATVQFTADATPVNVPILTAFDPEENGAFELGIKSELLDRRVFVDFDVYQSKWKSIVIPQIRTEVVDPRSGNVGTIRTPTAFNVNAGDATIRGAEFSVNARITDRVDGSFGVSYTDANYDKARVDSFKSFPSFSPTGDVSGKQILRTSPWQLAASLGYTAPLADGKAFFVRGDLSYRDKQFADATNEAITPDQTKLNMAIGLQSKQWTIELWGRNLTNEDSPSAAYRDVFFSNALPDGTFFRSPAGTTPAGNTGRGTFFPWRYSVSYPTLREFGLTARYKF